MGGPSAKACVDWPLSSYADQNLHSEAFYGFLDVFGHCFGIALLERGCLKSADDLAHSCVVPCRKAQDRSQTDIPLALASRHSLVGQQGGSSPTISEGSRNALPTTAEHCQLAYSLRHPASGLGLARFFVSRRPSGLRCLEVPANGTYADDGTYCRHDRTSNAFLPGLAVS